MGQHRETSLQIATQPLWSSYGRSNLGEMVRQGYHRQRISENRRMGMPLCQSSQAAIPVSVR